MKFNWFAGILPIVFFFGFLFCLIDFKAARRAYHEKRLRKAIKKYLNKETTNNSFEKDVIEIIQKISHIQNQTQQFQDLHLESLELSDEAHLRRSFAITGLPLSLEKDGLEKSAKVCGIIIPTSI